MFVHDMVVRLPGAGLGSSAFPRWAGPGYSTERSAQTGEALRTASAASRDRHFLLLVPTWRCAPLLVVHASAGIGTHPHPC